MIIDTSALLAVLFAEKLDDRIAQVLTTERHLCMSAATLTECYIVADRRKGPAARTSLDHLLARFEIEIVPYDATQANIAREAYRVYGKGSGHPAHLNMGDCFSYALAAVRGEPLLFVGDAFTHTDIRSVL